MNRRASASREVAKIATDIRGITQVLKAASPHVIACGIKRVVVGKIYRNPQAVDMMKEAGVSVEIYAESPKWRDELAQIFSEEIPDRTNQGEIKMTNSN